MNARSILKAVEAAILDERRQKRLARAARYRQKKKASLCVTLPTQTASLCVTHGKDYLFRGITWRDCPGRDEAAKKMRFALLRRGDWKGYKSCQFLEGDALKNWQDL
jgi:hypothetical protein